MITKRNDVSGNVLNAIIKNFIDEEQLLPSAVDEASATVTYYGWRERGSFDDGQPIWRIMKATVTGTVTTYQYADGDLNLDNIWANRAALTYKYLT